MSVAEAYVLGLVQPCNMSLASVIFAPDSLRQYFLPSKARMHLYEWQLKLGNQCVCSTPPPLVYSSCAIGVIISPLKALMDEQVLKVVTKQLGIGSLQFQYLMLVP